MLNWITNHKAMFLGILAAWTMYFEGKTNVVGAVLGTITAILPGLKKVDAAGAMVRQPPTSTPRV